MAAHQHQRHASALRPMENAPDPPRIGREAGGIADDKIEILRAAEQVRIQSKKAFGNAGINKEDLLVAAPAFRITLPLVRSVGADYTHVVPVCRDDLKRFLVAPR